MTVESGRSRRKQHKQAQARPSKISRGRRFWQHHCATSPRHFKNLFSYVNPSTPGLLQTTQDQALSTEEAPELTAGSWAYLARGWVRRLHGPATRCMLCRPRLGVSALVAERERGAKMRTCSLVALAARSASPGGARGGQGRWRARRALLARGSRRPTLLPISKTCSTFLDTEAAGVD